MRSWQISGTSIVHEPSDDFEALAASVHSAWVREAVSSGRDYHLKPYLAIPDDAKHLVRSAVRAVLDELCLTRVMKS